MLTSLLFAAGGFVAGIWINQVWRDRIKGMLERWFERLRNKVQ